MLEPRARRRNQLQRRRRVQCQRFVQDRGLYAGSRGDVHGLGLVPRRGHVRSGDGQLLESRRRRRYVLQRRQRLRLERHMQGGRLLRWRPRHLLRLRSVPRGRDVQPGDGHLLEPRRRRRYVLQRRQRLRLERHMQGGRLLRWRPRHLLRLRSVPRSRDLQPGDGHLLEPRRRRRYVLQRRQRLRFERHVQGGHLGRGATSPAAPRTSATQPGHATPRRGNARTPPSPTVRRAATATPAT